MIMVGDFMQLPPAGQTSLDTVPSHLSLLPVKTQVQSNHGLRLLWDGVTHWVNLTQQQRAHDEWWMEVVNQVRDGNLSQVHHQFLHGELTEEPGCWSIAKNECFKPNEHGRHGCNANCTSRMHECEDCKRERKRRCRVFNSGICMQRLLDPSIDRLLTDRSIDRSLCQVSWKELIQGSTKNSTAQCP